MTSHSRRGNPFKRNSVQRIVKEQYKPYGQSELGRGFDFPPMVNYVPVVPTIVERFYRYKALQI